MGMHDRDWYREEKRQERAKTQNRRPQPLFTAEPKRGPRGFDIRPGFWTGMTTGVVLGLIIGLLIHT